MTDGPRDIWDTQAPSELKNERYNGRKFVYIVPGTIFVAGTTMAFSFMIHIW